MLNRLLTHFEFNKFKNYFQLCKIATLSQNIEINNYVNFTNEEGYVYKNPLKSNLEKRKTRSNNIHISKQTLCRV